MIVLFQNQFYENRFQCLCWAQDGALAIDYWQFLQE